MPKTDLVEHDLTYNTSCSIPDLIILRLRELDQELGNLMIHIHHLEDRGSIVGDGDVTISRHHELVQSLWSQRRPQGAGNGPCSQNVRLEANRRTFSHMLVDSHMTGLQAWGK